MNGAVQMDDMALPSAPEPMGRRLSKVRVMISLLLLSALSLAAVVGWQSWSQGASAAEGRQPWFAGYVDVTATPFHPFETPVSPAGQDVVLSFVVADDDAPCTPTWGNAYTLDEAAQVLDLDRRLARFRDADGQALVSFGGLLNDELASVCTNPQALVAAYGAVVERYELDTIDLDIEGENLADVEAGLRRATAVAQLQQDRRGAGAELAVWLTLPVAPSGMTEAGTTVVAQMLGAGVDLAGVNVMTMNYASSREGEPMEEASVRALESTHRQLKTLYTRADIRLTDATLWSMIGATPMIGQNDVQLDVFGVGAAERFNLFAQQRGIGRLSMWSLNRDRECGPNYVNVQQVSDACSGVDQAEIFFADVLATGLDGRPTEAASAVTTSEADRIKIVVDDPQTSPYPIWAGSASYLEGTKVVWHGNVYQTKWWSRGDLPDNPVLNEWETPWTIIGPVLPGEKPYEPPSLPEGTYPAWDGTEQYDSGDRVLVDGTPYLAKWWTQGDSPDAASVDPDASPWVPLSEEEVRAVLKDLDLEGSTDGGPGVLIATDGASVQ